MIYIGGHSKKTSISEKEGGFNQIMTKSDTREEGLSQIKKSFMQFLFVTK